MVATKHFHFRMFGDEMILRCFVRRWFGLLPSDAIYWVFGKALFDFT